MWKLFKYEVLLAAVFLPAVSCSVKEDRGECPLFVYFNEDVNPHGSTTSATVRMVRGSEMTECGAFPMEEFMDEYFCVKTRRGANTCSVVCGGVLMGRNVIFRDGEAVPEVYALCESFETSPEQEEYCVREALCRQVAPVTLRLRSDEGAELGLRVRSFWAGFDFETLEPVAGDLTIDLDALRASEEDDCRVMTFNVPRQGDDSMVLEFLRDGVVAGRYRLGEASVTAGYDWSAKHLEPLSLSVSYSIVETLVDVEDWEVEVTFDYTI